MKESGKALAACGSSSIVKYLTVLKSEGVEMLQYALHDVALLLPKVVNLLVIGLSLEEKNINGR